MSMLSQKQFQWSTVRYHMGRIWLDCVAAADEHKESVFWCRKRNFPKRTSHVNKGLVQWKLTWLHFKRVGGAVSKLFPQQLPTCT